jgi:rhodanese-related sulfurtransferase
MGNAIDRALSIQTVHFFGADLAMPKTDRCKTAVRRSRSSAAEISRASIAAVAAVGLATPSVADEGHLGLTRLERDIAANHRNVSMLLPEQLERRLGEVVLLDVREASEFAVSHIVGAVRVAPSARARDVEAMLGDRVRGRAVVLYCSVGVRSSRMTARVEAALRARGATGVYNLSGGLFAWHNTGRSLARGAAASDDVHPYDTNWARYIEFRDRTRYLVAE